MSETIRVHLVRFKGRENYIMRYLDPVTGKQVARSTRTAKRRDAETRRREMGSRVARRPLSKAKCHAVAGVPRAI